VLTKFQGDGVFCPGGSAANMYGLSLARFYKFPESKSKGMQCLPLVHIYTSDLVISSFYTYIQCVTIHCVTILCDYTVCDYTVCDYTLCDYTLCDYTLCDYTLCDYTV